MPFPYDKYPWLNFQELNLAYFIEHFREIFQQWDQLLNEMHAWKDQTDEELAEWKSTVENGIASWETGLLQSMEDWKDETESDISTWEDATLTALDAWKTATTAVFEQIRTEAAESATAAANSASSAQTALAGALAAQAAAEAAAAGIQSALAQIQTNTADISALKAQIESAIEYSAIPNDFEWINGNISSTGTDNNTNRAYRVRTVGFVSRDDIEMLRCPQDSMFVVHMYNSESQNDWAGVWTGSEFAQSGGAWVKEFDYGKQRALYPSKYFRFVLQKDVFTNITPEYGKNLFIAPYNNPYSKIANSTAKDFNEFAAYTAGDYCWYMSDLYQFIDNKAAGSWDDTKAQKINILDTAETINDLKSLLDADQNYLFAGTWRRYTIGQGHTAEIGTTGFHYEPSTTRISTYNVQSIDYILSMTFYPDTGYKFGIHGFNADLSQRVFVTEWITAEYTPEFPDTVKYIVVVMAKTDDTTITPEEYVHLNIVGNILGGRLIGIENDITELNEEYEKTIRYKKETIFDNFCANFNVNGEVSAFLFLTDPHIYNKDVSTETINSLFHDLEVAYDSTPCNFLMCGGDWLQGGQKDVIPGGPTTDQACAQLGFVDGVMRKLYRKYKPVFGNHEFNINNTPLPLNTVLNLLFSEEGRAYYDFTDRDTHYYVLDTGNNNTDALTAYRKTQLDWLAEKLAANQEHHVVICCHIFYNTSSANPYNATITDMGESLVSVSSAFNSKSATYTAEWDATKTYDFAASTGTMHYIIAGHLHVDWIVQNSGILAVMTANALYNWQEPSFDLIANDYVNNIACMTRIGHGNNRYCHFEPVPISTTATLTASKISPVSWSSENNEIATVSGGVVTAVSTGTALITATADNGDIETWIVSC